MIRTRLSPAHVLVLSTLVWLVAAARPISAQSAVVETKCPALIEHGHPLSLERSEVVASGSGGAIASWDEVNWRPVGKLVLYMHYASFGVVRDAVLLCVYGGTERRIPMPGILLRCELPVRNEAAAAGIDRRYRRCYSAHDK